MEKTAVIVRLHANYIWTAVRFYKTPMCYVELSCGSPDAPAFILQAGDASTLYNFLMDRYITAKPDVNLPGFDGYAQLKIEFPDPQFIEPFIVTDFHVASPKRGGANLTNAFRNDMFANLQRRVLENFFNAIADQNVEKINQIFKSLSVAAGAKFISIQCE